MKPLAGLNTAVVILSCASLSTDFWFQWHLGVVARLPANISCFHREETACIVLDSACLDCYLLLPFSWFAFGSLYVGGGGAMLPKKTVKFGTSEH